MIASLALLLLAGVVEYDTASSPVAFAAAELKKINSPSPISLKIVPGAPQSYSIRTAGDRYIVTGGDAVGAMYGGLDLAEALRTGTPVKDSDSKPYIQSRGIKFNIPLDVRTPSYSDNSDSAQANIPEMWSMTFWREFLDEMARHRYNVLSLWSLHPFPSIVKVPEYPEVALNDVFRTKVKLDDSYSHTGHDMFRPELMRDTEVVRRMSIDDKITFWRDVMQYARDRGIDVYWFTWNIFTFGAAGKHGITQSQTNPVTIDYFRKSVRETVLTYPLLAGMGITAGEQMENRKDEYSKEKWLWKTYGEGIRDALTKQPGRKFRLIHRFHMTGHTEILDEFKQYSGPLDLSFKYSIAHMYSAAKPPFIDAALPYLSPKLRTWLTVRNDDIYSFRWADPEYARSYIKAMPGPDKVAGFYMGPDGYNWGRDYFSRDAGAVPQLVMQRQWYSFLLWGRLAYDPDLPEERLRRIVAQRFPQVPVQKLTDAWSRASGVFAEITRFFWGDIDLRWFPEACISHKRHKGWYTVRHFIEGITMPGSGNLDILTWRDELLSDKPAKGRSPLEVAAALESYSALAEVEALRKSAGSNKELQLTLGDIEAMSHLSSYYASKIRGAADLALFDSTADPSQQKSAVAHLEAAVAHWTRYARVYDAQYKPQLLNRVGYIDIPALLANVKADVEIARKWTPGTIKDESGKFKGADRPFRP